MRNRPHFRTGAHRHQRHHTCPVRREPAAQSVDHRHRVQHLDRPFQHDIQQEQTSGQKISNQRKHYWHFPVTFVSKLCQKDRWHNRHEFEHHVEGHVEVGDGFLLGVSVGVCASFFNHHLESGVKKRAGHLAQNTRGAMYLRQDIIIALK